MSDFFNPRLREGGDTWAITEDGSPTHFQSTPPRRRRHARLGAVSFNSPFQSTPPRRRRRRRRIYIFSGLIFQSTPPRRRRHKVYGYIDRITFSIHASAKEATIMCLKTRWNSSFQSTPPRRRRQYFVSRLPGDGAFSIHASAKEATWKKLEHICAFFQSTPPRRRRHRDNCFIATRTFSIHASAKEATMISASGNISTDFFNPRLREGGDRNIL